MFPVNNVNVGCWRAGVRQYYLFWVHCYSYTCLWGWKWLICPITSATLPKLSEQSQSISSLTSSLRRRVWGQCRWSKGLIPTRHNPAGLKYHKPREADTSEVLQAPGWPPATPDAWWKSEAKAAAFFSQAEPTLVSNMRVWNKKSLHKTETTPNHAINVLHTSMDASRSLLLKLLRRLSGSSSADSSIFNIISWWSTVSDWDLKKKTPQKILLQ